MTYEIRSDIFCSFSKTSRNVVAAWVGILGCVTKRENVINDLLVTINILTVFRSHLLVSVTQLNGSYTYMDPGLNRVENFVERPK